MLVKKMSLIGLLFLSLVSLAQAKNYEINYNHQFFQGLSIIDLKQDIKKLYPGLNLDEARLERVIFIAKSREGSAEARLVIGGLDSRIEQIDGNCEDFEGNGHYSRIVFESRNDKGQWKIQLQGQVKIKKMVVSLSGEGSRGHEITRRCGYVLKAVWGQDLERFFAEARGADGINVQAQACAEARRKCEEIQNRVALARCRKL